MVQQGTLRDGPMPGISCRPARGCPSAQLAVRSDHEAMRFDREALDEIQHGIARLSLIASLPGMTGSRGRRRGPALCDRQQCHLRKSKRVENLPGRVELAPAAIDDDEVGHCGNESSSAFGFCCRTRVEHLQTTACARATALPKPSDAENHARPRPRCGRGGGSGQRSCFMPEQLLDLYDMDYGIMNPALADQGRATRTGILCRDGIRRQRGPA